MSDSISLDQLQLALQTMYSNGNNDIKQEANKFLETFQKSQGSWNIIFEVLNTPSTDQDSLVLKMFVSQTLRSKVNYDLHQLPRESLAGLKDSIINLIVQYEQQGQKSILLQLCISLANFALQFMEWSNAVGEVVEKLSSNNCIVSLLEFLKVLPEELSDVKKTPLTDEEFSVRVKEIIDSNVERILILLTQFLDNRSSNSAQINALILDALNSWIREIPIEQMLSINSIASLIFESVTEDDTFDTSIECLITILRETRDIENLEIIRAIYQQLLNLKPYMNENKDDAEKMDGFTRLFVEAGESWHVLIAKSPKDFKPFVEILLELTAYDEDLDVVKYTFYFWYELKQMLQMDKFKEARVEFYDIYLRLIEVIIKHLQYPIPTNQQITNTTELFGGDREQQDKFKDFRYDMGDVLKDCCVVVGATNALNIPFMKIQNYVANPSLPWQVVEAPLFSLRSMAKEVSVKENKIMPSIMNLLIQLPENSKIRYASTLVLGRYTEWTAKHPEFLELQLNYITNGFSNADKDVLVAASHALLYFCQDCSSLLINYLEQLFQFYNNVAASLDYQSLYDVTEGISHILKEVDDEQKLYQITGMFWKPTLERLASYLQLDEHSDEVCTKIADEVEIITIYIKVLKPRDLNAKESPVSNLIIQEVWPIVLKLINKFGNSMKCSERLTKVVKESVITYGFFMEPIIPQMAEMLVRGFKNYRQGCYLWVSGILIRELSDGNNAIKQSIWQFSLQQSISFIQFLNELEHNKMTLEFPDLIEDFFRMLNDMLMFYPINFIGNGDLLSQIYEVSILSLSALDNFDPISSTLHFLIDLMSWGFDNPPISFFEIEDEHVLSDLKFKVLQFNKVIGERLIGVLLKGLVLKFPADCSLDASDLVTKLIRLVDDHKVAITWLNNAVVSLENVSEKERLKLLGSVEVAINNKDFRRVRSSIRDFVSWYLRKNIRSTNIV